MAYNSANLSLMSLSSDKRIFSYTTTDAVGTVNNSGYFNDSANMIRVGDVILVHDSNTPTHHWCVCVSNNGTVVDVSDGQVIAQTDGD
tara:strand:- start:2230 stop:2493 length:264 start_codon:yes stop_codon:yes gene_type:complete